MRIRLTTLVALALMSLLGGAADASGLLAPTDQTLPPLRITDHLVDVTIHDGIARTTVTQTFHNDTKRRLEATYVFPLPEDGDLTDFQMSFNGKMVEGKVLPAEEAARLYEQIVRRTKDPGLIEFIGRRLLQMRVFPIEPDSDTTIKMSYQQICRPISGMTGFHYPLRTKKTVGQAYGTVRFNVEVRSTAPLKGIWSPSHAVEIVRGQDENTARIAYEANGGSLEDDFLLLYDTDSSDLGLSVVAARSDEKSPGHFVLMLTPKRLWKADEETPQDIVFVVDTSGSMAGAKIEQAQASLKYCIEQLDDGDRFNVVRFSTGFDVLHELPQPATRERRDAAIKWIGDFRAAGGTNIADTLGAVLAMKRSLEDDARPFVTVFMTDGRGNREADEILASLREQDGSTGLRIFPFGVGHDVNTHLLDGLSDAFSGRTTYVQPGENLELVLGDFFSVISRPVLTDLRLSLPDIGVTERFPATLGDLYHGQQLVIAARFARSSAGPVKLTARRGGETVEYVWPDVRFGHTADADYVATVWAGRKIAFLIDQIRLHGESSEMIEEILALSSEHGIQTPYSSWFVNPEGLSIVRDREVRLRTRGALPPARHGGGGVDDFAMQREFLGRVVGGAARSAPASETASSFGDEHDEIDSLLAAQSVRMESGKIANLIARRNASLHNARNRDDSRLSPDDLPYRQIDGIWYNRVGSLLVDETIDADTELILVQFASEAYFDIVRGRADLRTALSSQPGVGVRVGPKTAVLVAPGQGTESLSDDQRKQIGLDARS